MLRPPVAALTSLLATSLLWAGGVAHAEVIDAGPSDDVESLINALRPGDELVLADGLYTMTERFSFDLAGTEATPIVIRAADGARPHFRRDDASENLWDIRAEWVEIRGLVFSGGSAGLRFETGRFVTIEGCEVYDTADVAVRMNDGGQLYQGMHIVDNHIHDTGGTGEAMYLGCNSNGCQLAGAIIEGNYIHHTDGADVSQGDGIEIKEGSYDNIVRDNVIHDTGYPCILTYSTVGNGGPNIIERNVLWGCGDHGIQSAADAVIRNNIVIGAGSDGIALQPHQAGAPSNLVVVHNTVLQGVNDALSIRGASGSVLVANNALYAASGDAIFLNGDSSQVTLAGNVGVGGQTGISGGYAEGDLASDFVDGNYDVGPPVDVFPLAGGALVAAGESAYVTMVDFDGTTRMGAADVGAYAFSARGPGWTIAEAPKDLAAPPPPVGEDAGVVVRRDGGTSAPASNGCGCRAVGARGPVPIGWLALLGVAIARRRRPPADSPRAR